MAEMWYNQPEVRSILDGLTHQDLRIVQIKDKFEWEIPNSLDARIEHYHEKNTDVQLGWTLDEALQEKDEDREERWYSFYEEQASLNDVLSQRFGDPNALFPFGLERANRIWERDPLCLLRKKK